MELFIKNNQFLVRKTRKTFFLAYPNIQRILYSIVCMHTEKFALALLKCRSVTSNMFQFKKKNYNGILKTVKCQKKKFFFKKTRFSGIGNCYSEILIMLTDILKSVFRLSIKFWKF